jgi:hypothetical protein
MNRIQEKNYTFNLFLNNLGNEGIFEDFFSLA